MLKLLKLIIVGLIPFVIWVLLIEFIFSFFSQSKYGPHLTFLNFAGPFLLTIVFILIVGQRLILKRDLIERFSVTKVSKLLIVSFILLLAGWQVWYLEKLHQIRKHFDVVEFGPMLFGLTCSLFLAAIIARKKHGN
jgi:hypothetical protein